MQKARVWVKEIFDIATRRLHFTSLSVERMLYSPMKKRKKGGSGVKILAK